jgi:uncharacterized membrane protein HdeD (DUF308 family)
MSNILKKLRKRFMTDKDWHEIALAFGMSILGGAAHMLTKLSNSEYKNLWGPIADMFMAGLAGTLAFFACKYWAVPIWGIGFATGVAAHGGVRVIKLFESWLAKRAGIDNHDTEKKS